jgi:hypothetical protein
MTNVRIAALFAAMPNNWSGNAPHLTDLFEGDLGAALTGADRRSEPDSPESAWLLGGVDDTLYSINIF